jgi:ABC-type Mn2+/Zn2+ transport system permease subunit
MYFLSQILQASAVTTRNLCSIGVFIYFRRYDLWRNSEAGSRNSSFGIATGYWLDGRDSFLGSVQTGSGAHPASYPMGTAVSFPGGKAAEA